jgi:hypothetical protein
VNADLGDQARYGRVKKAIDEKGRKVNEAGRRKTPTAKEAVDPVLVRCGELHRAFKASKPRDWDLLGQRNAALSDAEEAGYSLRALARATGMTHQGIASIISCYRHPADDVWDY